MMNLKSVALYLKSVRSDHLYSTKEVLALEVIKKTNFFGKSGAFGLYRLIGSGELVVSNVSNRPYKPIYAIKGSDLKKLILQRFKNVLK